MKAKNDQQPSDYARPPPQYVEEFTGALSGPDTELSEYQVRARMAQPPPLHHRNEENQGKSDLQFGKADSEHSSSSKSQFCGGRC
jgi:hypothetical protein